MASGYIIRKKSKSFLSFVKMMEWARDYYESHEKLWGPDGYITVVSYDKDGRKYTLRGISEWSESVINQVRFAGKYVCDLMDRREGDNEWEGTEATEYAL